MLSNLLDSTLLSFIDIEYIPKETKNTMKKVVKLLLKLLTSFFMLIPPSNLIKLKKSHVT
ncbi:hypothetical protein SDC9_205220 [bioreactor metagenome]|uniref:Uncharacterized protein n=1 Tax=bioreactor metagenome TaxID=1076179 RepID=A0A645J249_9ZZZZ